MRQPLIFELSSSGHRFDYAAKLAKGLVDAGYRPILATSAESADSSPFEVHFAGLSGKIDVADVLDRSRELTTFGQAADVLTRTLEQFRPIRAYVSYGDGLMQTVSLRGLRGQRTIPADVPAEVLTMRATYAYPVPWSRRVRAIAGLTLLRSCCPWSRVHHLDALGFEVACRGRGRFARVSRQIPEPVEPRQRLSRQQARDELGWPEDRKLVVCAGGLDRRKGVHLLIEAFDSIQGDVDNSALALVGRVAEDLRPAVDGLKQRLGDRLILLNRYVGNDEFLASIAAADLVAVPYPRHVGSSGLLVRAAAAGRPILASDWGWVGWATRTHRLGTTCDVTNRNAFAAALRQALEAAPSHVSSPEADAFVAYHSEQNFIEHWLRGIREDRY